MEARMNRLNDAFGSSWTLNHYSAAAIRIPINDSPYSISKICAAFLAEGATRFRRIQCMRCTMQTLLFILELRISLGDVETSTSSIVVEG